jgi:hypothetical protein
VNVSLALLRIFIEILSNSVDNVFRSRQANIPCSYIKIKLNKETGETSVINDGDIIPIEINPENKILIGEEEEIDIPKNKIKKSLLKNNLVIIQFGGNNSSIPTIGYQNKGYERKYFPTAKMFKTKEENILMSLAHGLYINIAKHISQKRYITCYPIKKTFCLPDPKTTLSLTQMPSFLFYNELFMMREGQKDLKLNLKDNY